ncbi:MAG: hypothetical protein ABR577_07380 [Pyrinomonadaceae bacterium]
MSTERQAAVSLAERWKSPAARQQNASKPKPSKVDERQAAGVQVD